MPTHDIWISALANLGRRAGSRLVAADSGGPATDRRLTLRRLLPLDPGIIDNPGKDAARLIVRKLASALRAERARGRAGHWTYDLNRHVALIRAYKAERRRLVQLAGAEGI